MVRTGSNETSPPDAVGYAAAQRAGLLPAVPAEPPRPLSGRSARGLLTGLVVVSATGVAVWLVVMLTLQQASAAGAIAKLGWLVVGLLGLGAVVLVGLRKVGDRVVAELEAGYATLTISFGSFWQVMPHPRGQNYQIPWDFSGVWLLTATGHVRRAPEAGAGLPPGFYPSVSRPQEWELWTGAGWGRVWRPAPPALSATG